MAVCTKPVLKVMFNPSTLKVQYNPNTKKVLLFPDCNRTLSGGTCCDGNWLRISALRFKIEGLYDCDTNELIDELEGKYFCVGEEDPCEFFCTTTNYFLGLFPVLPASTSVRLYVLNKVGLGGGTDLYFYKELTCAALPMTFANSLVIGDCGDPHLYGTVKGYDGTVTVS